MDRRGLVVLWAGILAIILSMVFPPYGYDHYQKWQTSPLLGKVELVETIPFKYLGYSFIFSAPPEDQSLIKLAESMSRGSANKMVVIFTPYTRIAWHILGVQISVIALVIAGVLITLRRSRKRTNAGF